MIIKELKFIGLLFFIIFAIILLVALVFLITYQRFQCSEYINYKKKIQISGKIETIIPFLQTGDIIISSNCFNENISKFKCFNDSRSNFVKNGQNYSHISMIYRKNNIVYLIDFIPSNRDCRKNYCLLNPNYENGLRIIYFNEYIKEYREYIRKKKYDCCQKFGIRFINRKINQDELNRRFENEFNILFDSKFISINKVKLIAASGWFLKDMQNNFQYSTEIFYPNDEKNTFFCSEIIGALLQRIGVMKRINRARMFYPADYNGSNDHNMFEKDMYSKIEIYE